MQVEDQKKIMDAKNKTKLKRTLFFLNTVIVNRDQHIEMHTV